MAFSQRLAARYMELESDPEAAGMVLLMQVGVFMHVMDEHARRVSGLTGLKLKMTGDVDAPHVTGGFPLSALDAYVGKLLRAGHGVAIAMQDDLKERHITEIINAEVTTRG